jgi:hypothetical protein
VSIFSALSQEAVNEKGPYAIAERKEYGGMNYYRLEGKDYWLNGY